MPASIDISLVRKVTGDRPEKIIELLQLYRQSLLEDAARLAALPRHTPTIASKHRIAHRIAGAARTIDARHLVEACLRVRESDHETIDHHVSMLQEQVEFIEMSVRATIANLRRQMPQ